MSDFSFYRKLLFAIASLFLLLMAVGAAFSPLLLGGFSRVEEDSTRRLVVGAQSAFNETVQAFNNRFNDWSAWDDTYEFVKDGNVEYIKSNLPEPSLNTLDINAIAFLNTDGKIVYGTGFDLKTKHYVPLPKALVQHFKKGDPLLRVTNAHDSVKGLIMDEKGPLMVAVHPIVTSVFRGPIRGTLIVGRYLDKKEIARLERTTSLDLDFKKADALDLPLDFRLARAELRNTTNQTTNPLRGPVFVRPLNQSLVAGYTQINDIYGQPAVIMSVTTDRTLYHQGVHTLNTFRLVLLLAGILGSLLLAIVFQREMRARLQTMPHATRHLKWQPLRAAWKNFLHSARHSAVFSTALLITVLAVSGLILMQQYSDRARKARYLLLTIKSVAHQQNSIEWQAMASGGIDEELEKASRDLRDQVTYLLDQMSSLEASNKDVVEITKAYVKYQNATDNQFGLLRQGKVDAAKQIDETQVDPSFKALLQVMSQAQDNLNKRGHRTEFITLLGTIFTLALTVFSTAGMVWYSSRVQAKAALLEAEQNTLRESEERFRKLVKNGWDTVLILQNGDKISYASPAIARVLGHEPESVTGASFLALLCGDKAPHREFFEKLQATSHDQSEPMNAELQLRHADGSLRDFEVTAINLCSEPGVEGIVINARDVTEKRRAENSAAMATASFRALVQSTSDAIVFANDKGAITGWNQGAHEIFGWSSEEMQGQPLALIIPERFHEEHHASLYAEARNGTRRLNGQTVELTARRKSGEEFPIEISITRLEMLGSYFFSGIMRDISERRKTEDKIRTSLHEKEVLLKEIHHRVKNNMQVISSILNLQMGKTSDAAMKAGLRESQNRIKSMALIHEKLYRSTDLAKVDFADYVQNLVAGLMRSYSNSGLVKVEYDLTPVFLDIDTAVPCGLMVNEFVSNALKHAFPDRRTGIIHVSLQVMNGDCETAETAVQLIVQDDGIGFPDDVDFRETDSLGLQLVNSLTDQIEGEVQIVKKNGTQFILTFPLQERKKNNAAL